MEILNWQQIYDSKIGVVVTTKIFKDGQHSEKINEILHLISFGK